MPIDNKYRVIQTLFYKNYLVFKGNLKKYLMIYLSPLFILLIVLLLQYLAQQKFQWVRLQTSSSKIQQFPKCTIGLNKQKCVSLAYTVYGQKEPQINYIIDHIKKQNHLTDNDVQQYKLEPQQINSYFSQQKNRNVTQALILFCTAQGIKYKNSTIPCTGQQYHTNFYVLYMNVTLFHKIHYSSDVKQGHPKDQVNLKLKYDIDSALIKYYYQKKYGSIQNFDYQIQLSTFPSKSLRFVQGISIMSYYGALFILIPYLILLVMQSSQLLKQKQNRIRIGLNIVGVSHFQFYFAQLMYYLIHVIMISISFCFFGYILRFQFFTNAIIWFNMLILIINGFAIGLLAFCVTAAVNQKNLGMSIIYGFVLYSLIMQNLLVGEFLQQYIYMWNPPSVIKFLKFVFSIYPAFHFSKIFSDIQRKAGMFFSVRQNGYLKGNGFYYNDLFQSRTIEYDLPYRHGMTAPSTLQSSLYLILTLIVLFFVLFSLDKLIESNRGYKQDLFSKSQKLRKYLKNEQQQDLLFKVKNLVKINNLQKKYNKKVFALKGVTFDILEGQIVSLLGQNGAGKSTLINILIGALSPTSGQVIIDGYNVNQNIKQVRKILGVCPQFDILWQDITAYDHMYIFSRLKGVSNIEQSIKQGLEKVNLWKNRNGKVGTFSGGMKRRLSLAISFLGKPKLIVLDEPTTGMDVKIRLQTWKIILQMRGQTTILITTHNMQQSQCLSDRIIIMNKGRLVTSGTSISLKKQFGAGYIIKGIDPKNKSQITIKCKQKNLQKYLQSIQQQGLQNWSLRQTTLQQVFLNAIKKF